MERGGSETGQANRTIVQEQWALKGTLDERNREITRLLGRESELGGKILLLESQLTDRRTEIASLTDRLGTLTTGHETLQQTAQVMQQELDRWRKLEGQLRVRHEEQRLGL